MLSHSDTFESGQEGYIFKSQNSGMLNSHRVALKEKGLSDDEMSSVVRHNNRIKGLRASANRSNSACKSTKSTKSAKSRSLTRPDGPVPLRGNRINSMFNLKESAGIKSRIMAEALHEER